MKTNLVRFCVVVLASGSVVTLGQKTEVRVQKGKVLAQSGAQSVAVEPGWKAVLMPGRQPIVTIDDPLVNDVMGIYKWVEAEKQAQPQVSESTDIMVIRVDEENRCLGAMLDEVPNTEPGPTTVRRIRDCSLLDEPKFYDLQGHVLPFELEQSSALKGDYTLHFPEPIPPGESFRYICVAAVTNSLVWQREGPLWILPMGVGRTNCLTYYRVILPKSAVLIDSSQPIVMTNVANGRIAVTVHYHTGPALDAGAKIAFLWPEKDGTSLADLPARYRGLRGRQQEEVAQEGRRRVAQVLAGETFDDQSTPLTTLLSLYSAVTHKDTKHFLRLVAPGLRELAAGQTDVVMNMAGSTIPSLQLLDTPDWPPQPDEGYEHPVYLAREGSQICDLTLVMVYEGGKWYVKALENGRTRASDGSQPYYVPGDTSSRATLSPVGPDLGEVVYDGLEPGKFMRKWLFVGPLPIPWAGEGYFPDAEAQRKAFDADLPDLTRLDRTVKAGDTDYPWMLLQADQGVIDLTAVSDRWYVIAYARAQVNMPEEKQAVLGIGSDDSVKVWLNGQLVHEHWETVGRGAVADNDRVPVTFEKGANLLVLKIQNGGGPWGFVCRLLED
jgi:hypothetical protein